MPRIAAHPANQLFNGRFCWQDAHRVLDQLKNSVVGLIQMRLYDLQVAFDGKQRKNAGSYAFAHFFLGFATFIQLMFFLA